MKTTFLFLFILFSFCIKTNAQEAFRFNSDFLFRAKGIDNLFHITKGKVYFDKNYKTLVFKNTFPQKETFVIKDTNLYIYHGDTLITRKKNIIPPEHTMFNYLLSSTLSTYGLEQSGFEIKNVEKKQGIVVSTWIPKGQLKSYIGKIIIANKEKKLYSVVIYDKDLKMMNRQIFKNYKNIKGTEIPSEILSITYMEDSIKYTQITNLNNIILNDMNHEELYRYKTHLR